MKFGIFDHLDLSGDSIAEHYENRLKLIEAYDRAEAIHGYFVAEHHSTLLGLASSPSVFLSAVAQRTRRLRFGPMVYQLGLHNPLRLLEEICMLDQMSGGRFEIGVGRGQNPVELSFFRIVPENHQANFDEALAVVRQGLTAPVLNFEGRFHVYKDVPLVLKPVQKPHPPMWYGAGRAETAIWAARNEIHIGSHMTPTKTRVITDAYRLEWAALGRDPGAMPNMALTQHLVIADTDREARAIADRVYPGWLGNFYSLYRRQGIKPSFTYPEDFDGVQARGDGISGSPQTVRDLLRQRIAESGTNYLFCRFAFGRQTLAEELRSLDLFTREVAPGLADAHLAPS